MWEGEEELYGRYNCEIGRSSVLDRYSPMVYMVRIACLSNRVWYPKNWRTVKADGFIAIRVDVRKRSRRTSTSSHTRLLLPSFSILSYHLEFLTVFASQREKE